MEQLIRHWMYWIMFYDSGLVDAAKTRASDEIIPRRMIPPQIAEIMNVEVAEVTLAFALWLKNLLL